MFFLVQTTRLLAFFFAKSHCWLKVSSESTRTPRLFSAKLLSIQSASSLCWGYYFPGAGFCSSFCSTSWDFWQCISPACQGPYGWQHNPPVYQLLLPLLCCLQTCILCPSIEVINEDVEQSKPWHWLAPGAHHWWWASRCTWCLWLPCFEPGSSASFQSISLSTSLACTLSVLHHIIYLSAL